MAELYDWKIAADDNDASPPNGWPENMSPALINNAGRELMAVIARYRQAADGCNATTGSANAYHLQVPQTVTALTMGMRFSFCPHVGTIIGAATLQVNSAPVTSLRGAHSSTFLAGELRTGTLYVAVYNGTHFVVLNPSITDASGIIPLFRIPDDLTGKDVDKVGGFSISTSQTGDDANTIYFRT